MLKTIDENSFLYAYDKHIIRICKSFPYFKQEDFIDTCPIVYRLGFNSEILHFEVVAGKTLVILFRSTTTGYFGIEYLSLKNGISDCNSVKKYILGQMEDTTKLRIRKVYKDHLLCLDCNYIWICKVGRAPKRFNLNLPTDIGKIIQEYEVENPPKSKILLKLSFFTSFGYLVVINVNTEIPKSKHTLNKEIIRTAIAVDHLKDGVEIRYIRKINKRIDLCVFSNGQCSTYSRKTDKHTLHRVVESNKMYLDSHAIDYGGSDFDSIISCGFSSKDCGFIEKRTCRWEGHEFTILNSYKLPHEPILEMQVSRDYRITYKFENAKYEVPTRIDDPNTIAQISSELEITTTEQVNELYDLFSIDRTSSGRKIVSISKIATPRGESGCQPPSSSYVFLLINTKMSTGDCNNIIGIENNERNGLPTILWNVSIAGLDTMSLVGAAPVSYTHLDVYKRQDMTYTLKV